MEYQESSLSYEVYCTLRESVGWMNFSKEQTRRALKNALYTVTAVEDGHTIGMGRLLGDGMYYQIVDIVVHPQYQHHGIGSRIMDLLLDYVERETPSGGRSSIQLIAEKGKEGFYLQKGFKEIPHEFCGSGMRKIIQR